jgi:hypothetical protein
MQGSGSGSGSGSDSDSDSGSGSGSGSDSGSGSGAEGSEGEGEEGEGSSGGGKAKGGSSAASEEELANMAKLRKFFKIVKAPVSMLGGLKELPMGEQVATLSARLKDKRPFAGLVPTDSEVRVR